MAAVEHIPLDVTPEQIAAFCEKWGIAELSLFGSVLRDDFGPESDVDVLFVPKPDGYSTSFTHSKYRRLHA